MISENTKRILIVTLLTLVVTALLVTSLLVDVDLKVFKLNSVDSLFKLRDDLIATQKQLATAENAYKQAIEENTTGQTSFTTEKKKYEAISDETIKTIKDATTQENYSIEYMWIKLGNYATANNLSIAIADPGTALASDKTSTTTTSITTTSSDEEEKSNEAVTTSSDEDSQAVSTSSDESSESNENVETLFTIRVGGSYLDVADFVFEVENDKELKFKLDNISMDYVSGNNISAKFNVKNLIIKK